MVSTALQNWVACVGAFFLITLTPLATASNWPAILFMGSLWWLFGAIIRPILKLILLPFNIISLGAIGAIVQFIAIWLLFWLIPTFQLHAVTIWGFQIGGALLIMLAAFVISVLQRLLLTVFNQLFH